MAGAPAVPGDSSHLRSGALLDVVPAGWGNRWEGRYLKQHFRITVAAFERAGIPVTELHRVLLARLARVGLEIKRIERRLDQGGLTEAELRRYHTLSTQHLAVLREIVLRPPRVVGGKLAEDAPPSFADILDEMGAAR
jgi:hypothetical protein